MFKKVMFATAFVFMAGLIDAKAQQAVMTAGGNASSNEGNFSYTIGQVAFTTNNGSVGSVSQGVQQPYEISVLSGVSETDINLDISAYPNPVSSYLIINVSEIDKWDKHEYRLFNTEGKILREQRINETQTKIDMNGLNPGTYFLEIIKRQSLIKTFKIIKN